VAGGLEALDRRNLRGGITLFGLKSRRPKTELGKRAEAKLGRRGADSPSEAATLLVPVVCNGWSARDQKKSCKRFLPRWIGVDY